jgi:alkylhydroperoxidase/carboxymuconolactone decarboxylase family protein YurZ
MIARGDGWGAPKGGLGFGGMGGAAHTVKYAGVLAPASPWRSRLAPQTPQAAARSLVTVAALIARQQTSEMAAYMDRALDHGVKPAELSETITHLARGAS